MKTLNKFGFPVILSGGIGDCLLAIEKLPLRPITKLGFKLDFYYTTPGHPAEPIIREFSLNLPKARWLEQPPSLPSYRIRNLFNRFSLRPQVPPIPGWLAPHQLPSRGPLRILLHTHMDGHHGCESINAKVWTVEAWSEVIRLLQSQFGAEIHLIEWHEASRRSLLHTIPGIIDAVKSDLLNQCLHLQTMDLVISVDSWSKYPARWANLPQVVIVPDLRRNYVPAFKSIKAETLVRTWFSGLIDRADTILLGLERRGFSWQLTLPSIHQLTPADIIRAVKLVLPYCRRPFYNPTHCHE